jgi:hypothetical protein
MKKYYFVILLFSLIMACKKQDEWLDIKSKKSDVILSSLKDYQALLDNTDVFNDYYPTLGLVGADNYYVTTASWQALVNATDRNLYIWAKDIYESSLTVSIWEWTKPFQAIEYANVALEGTDKIAINGQNGNDWNNVRGSALFYRAFTFYNLAQLYAKPYNEATADEDLGIPLRETSDVNAKYGRATMRQTYAKIISDLQAAERLLPLNPLYKTRPSKIAANALLAKIYLVMSDYTNAGKYADIALSQNNSLLDFNTLSTIPNYSFPEITIGNPEMIFYARGTLLQIMSSDIQMVSPELYNSYQTNDLRKSMFYRTDATGNFFTGKYTGNVGFFSGLATNELYFIRAECAARAGDASTALSDLNAIMIKRWNKNSVYQPYILSNAEDALVIILKERRKELPFTSNTRWEDLRRLNREQRFSITLTRTINNINYSLAPNDPRYVYPIPPLEIEKSGIEQNIR